MDSDVNSLKLKTQFDTDKFLVYNDAYNSQWQVFIDGKRQELFRANIAFKGMWVPAGEHVVYLRYGALWRYGLKYVLFGLFWFVFLYGGYACYRRSDG